MKEVARLNCGREHDLVGFLYGELNDSDARSFKQHLRECASCHSELAGFGEVRDSVVNWRNESLGGQVFPVTAISPLSADLEKHSAATALRQFFAFSPWWLKGAVALASLLLCVLAGMAVMGLRGNAPAPVVTRMDQGYSQQDLDALVERRVEAELQRQRDLIATPAGVVGSAAQPRQPRTGNRRRSVAANLFAQKAKRPLSKAEREQLAADLRLTSPRTDTELNLLEEQINQ